MIILDEEVSYEISKNENCYKKIIKSYSEVINYNTFFNLLILVEEFNFFI